MCLKCAVSSTSTRAHIALSPMIGGVNLFVGLDSSNVDAFVAGPCMEGYRAIRSMFQL